MKRIIGLLLKEGNYIKLNEYQNIYQDCNENISLLVSIVKTIKLNLGRK
jgi:hypothetical protein